MCLGNGAQKLPRVSTGSSQEALLFIPLNEVCYSIVAARNEEKSKKAVEEIIKETGNDKVEFMKLDLLSLAAVKTFVKEFKLRYDSLHILINNAGVMMCPFGLSADGIDDKIHLRRIS